MAAYTLENNSLDELKHSEKCGRKGTEYNKFPSLFDPDTDDEFSSESSSDPDGLTRAPPSLLHISEVVKEPLKTLSDVLEILLPRLQPSQDVIGVSIEVQQSLVSILVGELSSQFSILHHYQIDDPFLDSRQNRMLHKQISIDVCLIIEQLYGEFIYRAANLNCNGPNFSSNMTQLRAELMIEANRRLNIPAIRRKVLKSLRGPIVSEPAVQRYCDPNDRLPSLPKWRVPKGKAVSKHADVERAAYILDQSLSTESKLSRFGFRWSSKAIQRRIAKLQIRLPPEPMAIYSSSDEDEEVASYRNKAELATDDIILLHKKKRYSTGYQLHRVSSHPELWGDFLLCDLGVTTRHKRPDTIEAKEALLGLHKFPSFVDLEIKERGYDYGKPKTMLGEYTSQQLTEDLYNLEQHTPSHKPISEDDLHPLLQAHIHGLSQKQAARLAEFEASLRKQEEVSEKAQTPVAINVMEQSIPSVSTLDQLPYLNIEHASDPASSNLSLHVKSAKSDGVKSMVASSGRMESCSGYLESNRSTHLTIPSVSDMDHDHEEKGGTRVSTSLSVSQKSAGGEDSVQHSPQSSGMSSPAYSPTAQNETMVDLEKVWEDNLTLGEPSGFFNKDLQVAVERRDEKDKAEVAQTATVTAQCPGQGVVRTADVRVSERTPLMQIRQKHFGPIYNHLAEDWDSTTTEELDSNLHEGKEVTSVYEELMKTLPMDHLKFVTEPTLEPSLETPVSLSKILASRTLHHRRSQRVINQNLHRNIPPPWTKEFPNRETWEESNQYKGADLEMHQNARAPYSNEISHNYLAWLNNWKATVNPDDFFKFASRKESDYLRLAYHLYDSEGSDSEDEAERKEKREKLAALQAKLKAKEVRRRQRYRAKSLYQSGEWNTHTVTMGGLGKDPDASSSEEEDITEKENLRKLHGKASNLETIQKNLQQIWTRLYVPSGQQIDMAIKYSGDITQMQLHKVLNLWESVCDVIERRESALLQLESFETKASDPSRFFNKGQMGSASMRLSEAKERDRLHKVLDGLDKKVSILLIRIQRECGDIVTYKGRPYSEKMRLDRTELLYWLQQARRQAVVKPSVTSLTIDEVFVSTSQSKYPLSN